MSDAGHSTRPNTLFAADSSPEAVARRRQATLGFYVAFAVVSPLTVLTILVSWAVFSWGRISWKVMAFIAMFAVVLVVATGTAVDIGLLYVQSWYILVQNMIAAPAPETFISNLPMFFLRQLPGSLLIGSVIGAIYCGWAWYRRPAWEELKLRPTPWQWLRRKQHVNKIEEDKKGPLNGCTLGVTFYGKRIIQTDDEASAHTLFVGASGVGKTTTMMLQARDIIRRGHSLVYIDLKGGHDVPAILADYSKRYDRKFVHWLMHDHRKEYTGPAEDGPAYYDPIGRGDSTRRKDLIIEGRRWSEDYYKILASSYLQTAFEVSISAPREGQVDAFSDIIHLLEPENLKYRALQLPSDPSYDYVREDVDRWISNKLSEGERTAISGVRDELQTIRSSIGGKWLRRDPQGDNNINLKKAADEGTVIVFSLDASNYEGLSKLVANLIIQDLKTVTSELRNEPSRNPLHVFIDEFSAAGSDNVVGLINKARDAKVPVSLATQALADLKKVDPAFLDQLLGIINCFVIHRANKVDDAEVYAGLTGMVQKWKVRYGMNHSSGLLGGLGKGSGSGEGHVEQQEDFRVSPSEIQDLKKGEIFYIAKSPKLIIERVQVIPERGKLGQSDGNHGVRHKVTTTPRDVPLASPVVAEKEDSIYHSVNESLSTNDDNAPSVTPRQADPEKLKTLLSAKSTPPVRQPKLPPTPMPPVRRPLPSKPSSVNGRPSERALPTTPRRAESPTVPATGGEKKKESTLARPAEAAEQRLQERKVPQRVRPNPTVKKTSDPTKDEFSW